MWEFQDYCITEILREINFVDSRSAKTTVFAILGGVKFVNLGNFGLQIVQKFKKNENSEPVDVLKWQILHFLNLQIWINVKSEW